MADARCPRCGYASDSADFAISGGTSGTSDSSSEALRTPAAAPNGSGTVPLTVRGASSGNLGLANYGGRVVNLARRMPVQRADDIMVSRSPDGSAVVRHRQGGAEVGLMRRNGDGTWQAAVDGRDLTPHRQQRSALIEMFAQYNRSVSASPLAPPPAQTPLMAQYGVPAIRLAADDDTDNDDSASADTSSGSNGLTPRGQGIYKKLVAKGVKPAVAMAMAKRAQNTTAGSFGSKAS